MTEKKMISGLKKGDKKALEALIKEFSPYVYTIVRNIIGGQMSEEDIEEACSDCFVKLWRLSAGLKPDRPVSPYLAACARSCAINKLRELRTSVTDETLFEELVSPDDVEEQAEAALQIELVTDCISGLSSPERELFIRYYYYGEKLRDICAHMGITEPAGKTKLFRTREKLKKTLAERGYTYEKK